MSEVNEATAFLSDQERLLIDEGRASDDARQEALADFCHILLNANEFVYVD